MDAMPTFDGRSLVPAVPPVAQGATALVEVSSGDSRGGGKEYEEEEERDSEATTEGTGETSPRRRASILRPLPDDDEADAIQEKEDPPMIPTRGRSALISREAASARTPPGAASSPSAASSSAPGALAAAPQAARLSGFKISKRKVVYTAVDQ